MMRGTKNKREFDDIGRKQREIYKYIRREGAVSKQDIVIDLMYSLPTISQNLQFLTELGLIDTSGQIENTGGRNATAYAYLSKARQAIGVYLTSNHINVVAIDLSGNVSKMQKVREVFNLEDDNYLKKIANLVEEVKTTAEIDEKKLLGVGIAVPGLVTDDGEYIIYGQVLNITGRTRKEIAKYIPYKNRLLHDSAAAGFAEVWLRPDTKNAFYISLNNSVGGAVVVNNEIYRGNSKKSGEIGHMTVCPEGGERCYCGRYGCFDTVCTATKLDQYTDGNLGRFFELVKEGDPEAGKIWNTYLDDLARGINNIRVLFDSNIIIGGYVGAYIEEYLDELCSRVDERNPFSERAKDYISLCKYKAESAAAGAAIWYIDDFINNI